MDHSKSNRRKFLALGAGLATLQACNKDVSEVGAPLRPYGERSPFETAARDPNPESITPGTGSTRTPLQDVYGMITPSSLHFERHHGGVPNIDPSKHELLIHGLVEKPIVFTVADIHRYPAVSRIYFVECSGNSGAEQGAAPRATPQLSHGLVSCSQWTGVPLSTLLKEAGVKPEAKWMLAEGADSCHLARSIPVDKAFDDVLVAYGQNGEAIRPEQGYPLRLIVPGWEGNINVKWVHRLHFLNQPGMTSEETAYYTELQKDGRSQIFSFLMEAKSVITRPAGAQKLTTGPGTYQVTGIAWSGHGKITRVEISSDDGKTWKDAELEEPVLSRAITRFRMPWTWDGQATSLQSRATDESGYLQPTRDEIVAVRGTHSNYHYNGIKTWYVKPDGSVMHV